MRDAMTFKKPGPAAPDRPDTGRRFACRTVAIAVGAFALIGASSAETVAQVKPPDADSWPSFRNGNAQLGIAGTTLPEKPELLWKITDPYGFSATAAIVDDHVYAGGISGYLYCLDRATGREIWKYRSIDNPDPDAFAPAFKSAPTVAAELVLVGDEDGVLHAVSRETGKRKWKFTTGAEIVGGAALVGETVIVGSHDSHLYCLKLADGSLVWKFQTLNRINCSPAVVGKYTFVAGCDEHLRVINIETGEERSDIPLRSFLIASPAVKGEMLYVGTYAGEVLAVNWKEEKIAWRYRDPVNENPYHASAAVTDRLVLVGGQDKQMHCIDRETGKRVWAFRARAQINSSPVVVGDRVFFGSNDRNVYGVRVGDGKEVWRYNVGGRVTAGPAVGEGVLVVGVEADNGGLLCFGKRGAEPRR